MCKKRKRNSHRPAKSKEVSSSASKSGSLGGGSNEASGQSKKIDHQTVKELARLASTSTCDFAQETEVLKQSTAAGNTNNQSIASSSTSPAISNDEIVDESNSNAKTLSNVCLSVPQKTNSQYNCVPDTIRHSESNECIDNVVSCQDSKELSINDVPPNLEANIRQSTSNFSNLFKQFHRHVVKKDNSSSTITCNLEQSAPSCNMNATKDGKNPRAIVSPDTITKYKETKTFRKYASHNESVSADGKEYIKEVPNSTGFAYLCEFILRRANPQYKLNICNLGDECILVANNDKFIARVEMSANLQLSKSFEDDKLEFLKHVIITKVLEDELMLKRNDAYSKFLQLLERRSANISNSIECTDDFLQLLLMTKHCTLAMNKPLMFLKGILQNEHISQVIKNNAKCFERIENKLYFRNEHFPKFSSVANPRMKDLLAPIRNICESGIYNHEQNLIKSCPTKNSYLLCHILSIRDLPKDKVLFINKGDIELFSNAVAVAHEEKNFVNQVIPLEFIKYLWNKFYSKVQMLNHNSVKEIGPLTHHVYYYLLKSFRDIACEIASKTNIKPQELLVEENGNFRIITSIPWSNKSTVHKSLEKQYELYFQLLEHFEPGSYSSKIKFKYSFKILDGDRSLIKSLKEFLLGTENSFPHIPEDRLVWLYIVDCGTAPLLCDKSSNHFKELSLHVLKGFIKFIEQAKQDRYESFRIATLNIIKFIMQLSPYFNDVGSILTDADHNILDKQMEIINCILNSNETNVLSDYFSGLMDVYNEYWKLREMILENLPVPCSIFKDDVEVILGKILKLVESGLSKCTEAKLVIRFFRFYNEFLKHIRSIDFSWLISKACYTDDLNKVLECVIKNDVTSYVVKDPESFVQILERKKLEIPRHFLIETINKLLDIIDLVYEKLYWSNEDYLNAIGDLFLAIGHSFTHFEDQVDYNDLEHFLRDCTAPYNNVVTNSDTYEDFKKRLDNVENFFLYARKQNQIGIERALHLCEIEVKRAKESGFNTSINRSILENCYNVYSEKLGSLEQLDIPEILEEIKKDIEKQECLPLEQWTPSFKQTVIPVLLAGVAAVWTILESKDVANIMKRIEPHCVQILCILRLLGVDYLEKGVPKHFAQVLTGQGKSVIFGLLSVIIALTGNKASVVCYSEYLAQRDEMAFSDFFESFSKFEVGDEINYQTFYDLVFDSLKLKANDSEKNMSSVVQDLVLNEFHPKTLEFSEQSWTSVLLIDEVDVFFSDNFYGNTLNLCVNINMPALLEIQPKLWEIVEGGLYEKTIVMEKMRDFIIELLKEEKYEKLKNFITNSNSLFEQNLEKMISDAISVSQHKNESVWFIERYKIDFNGLLKFRDNLGIYRSTFHGYYNVFNYFRLKKENFDDKYYQNYGYIQIGYGSISYANVPSRYQNILGVSGTLMTLDESEKNAIKNYGIKTMSAMPSFFGERKLVFTPISHFTIQATESNWHSKIFEHISQNIKLNRAILVFFDTDAEIKGFEEIYRSNINRLYVLIGNEEPSVVEWRINESGVSQTVTLATRAMGRGIDYKSNDRSVEENGGVHVIQTFFSLDEKEETQIKGRTARKDNKGSYELILCREHLKEIRCSETASGCLINTYEEICVARNEIANKRGKLIAENIKKAEEKHKLTYKFFESLVEYTPEKRMEYLSKYPFIKEK
ncbi:uncharacterized protein [Parasteatoda tepidariorum]|uniref:uncharacterized protein n=1 Tax=Parasteatoda tepidariorum TaxID=114398 RepID=UPI001C71D435|nr:uncharacterized protein LOC122272354 [Parasteatoda tepidariorum]